jgi:SAM-dependent methyltransferase
MTGQPIFDLESSRRYWRHAPAGDAKLDTTSQAAADHGVWDAAFRSRIFTYPEEDQFLRTFAARARGRRILSIGSGLGFHELYYASAGAAVTCCDIVASNLQTIERIATDKGLAVSTVWREDFTAQPLPTPADIVFVYGCLMHMPVDAQRALLARAREALAPGGSVVLMVYGWEFPRRTCGWQTPAEFDPVVFAKASDPAVDGEACPWSDWHDDDKLLALAGSSARVVRRQAWNDGQFYWYELDWATQWRAPETFFDARALGSGELLRRYSHRDFAPVDSSIARGWRSTTVRTAPSQAHYAVESAEIEAPDGANAVTVDLSVECGAFSGGILDTAAQRFVSVATCTMPGRRTVLLLADPLPARFRVVLSTHQPAAAASGVFHLYGARVLRRPIASLPANRLGRS